MIRSLAAAAAAAALGSWSSRLTKALLGAWTKSRHESPASMLYGGAEPLGLFGCSPKPPPQPWASTPFHSRDDILTCSLAVFRKYIKDHVAGGSENQLGELKLRLITLRIYKHHCTAEDILKDPRLDLESLPLVSKHEALECINRYISVLRTLDKNDAYFRCLMFLVIGDYINLSTSPSKLVQILGMRSAFLELDKFDLLYAVKKYIGLCNLRCPSSSEASKIRLLENIEQNKDYAMSSSYMMGLDTALFTISSQRANELSANHENAKQNPTGKERKLVNSMEALY